MNAGLGRRIWTAILTGVPFAVYKFGFGWYEYHHDHSVLGIAAMVWGTIDFFINLLVPFLPQNAPWCLLAYFGQLIDRLTGKIYWENFLLAVDTIASFLIVSIMIWFGRLPLEPNLVAYIWNLAVIGNILSVGIEQLYRAATINRSGVESDD